ncbi:UDP-glucose 6-dehydrogenase 2-like [Rosa rugosa]|uniref:UDP-glucose 6-dehydrogenase 2-like n=1 Tax=Rosa rugosa TaxID=74645 RepID=UPI002B4015CC|nr:UDP-glucose 6-dehydrogenase 2-like [Rosa rugosa]
MPVDMFNLTTRFLSQRPQAQVQQNIQFAVFSNPELSCPGQMLNDMQFPDQVIIARKSDVGDTDILVEMYAQWVPAQRIIVLPNPLSAELGNIITSVMAGLKITVMNVISSYCEKVGANFNHVKQMLGRDYRFEDAFMESTLGIGGPDLLKDIVYCKDALQNVGLVTEAKLFSDIIRLDKKKREHFVQLMLNNMSTLAGKRVAVYGVTYKSNMADLTNSPAVSVCKALQKEWAIIRIYDPLRDENAILNCFRNRVRVGVVADPQQAYQGAHAILFLVNTNLQHNFQQMRAAMVEPPFLFFAYRLNVNYDALRLQGFQVHIFGNQE